MDRMSRTQLVAYAVIAVAVLVLGGRWLSSGAGAGGTAGGGGAAPALGGSGADRSPAADGGDAGGPVVSAPSRRAVVHVAGAVRRPGVYRLGPGARVLDAVRRAGGVTRRGDPNAINLAAPVQDGVQVVVPRRAPAGAAAVAPVAAGGAEGAAAGPPVNLNSATAEQLETLDGIGPATAAKILAYRREHGGFRSIEDLGQVSGIGPKRLEALRGHVVV